MEVGAPDGMFALLEGMVTAAWTGGRFLKPRKDSTDLKFVDKYDSGAAVNGPASTILRECRTYHIRRKI
jgi:hypothetical protein